MCIPLINEVVKSFDFDKEARFYKIDIMALQMKINKTGLVQNLDWERKVPIEGPSKFEIVNQDQIELLELLKLFNEYDFNLKKIRKKINDNIYPPMHKMKNADVRKFCDKNNYTGIDIAKYWIKVVLSHPDYFTDVDIFH